MVRKIIEIDDARGNGCGLCAKACHEGAIGMVDGKAKLLRDDYCDGLGDCLPACPTGAISFVEREASAYDAEAVAANQRAQHAGCPGMRAQQLRPSAANAPQTQVASQLAQWPVQIQLVAPNAPYFHQADLLIAADCTAFAYGNFHDELMRGRVTLIGCPKLDSVEYSEKLTAILRENEIRSVTVVRMEVPCCGGLAQAAERALHECGKRIPSQVIILSTDGRIL